MKKAATPRTALAAAVAKVLQRLHYPLDVMLLCVRWYVAYSLSLRNLEEWYERLPPVSGGSEEGRWVLVQMEDVNGLESSNYTN